MAAFVGQVQKKKTPPQCPPTAPPADAGVLLATPTAILDPMAIDASRYLDDRSDAVQVLRSLFNAVNRHEYVRAYSYWKPNASQLLPFATFQQGYMATQSVVINTGQVQEDFGAGQLRYRVPVILIALRTHGQ